MGDRHFDEITFERIYVTLSVLPARYFYMNIAVCLCVTLLKSGNGVPAPTCL